MNSKNWQIFLDLPNFDYICRMIREIAYIVLFLAIGFLLGYMTKLIMYNYQNRKNYEEI